jgi:biotin transport system substrate-specific component
MTATLLTLLTTRTDSRGIQMAERAGAVVFITVLTAIAAQISIPLPFTPVPFTFQPMAVLVGAAALGARLGAASQALYLALGIAGLPVFAASPLLPQGVARLFGPTGGYLLSYPVAAFVTGWLAERGLDRRYWTSFAAMLAGLAVVFAGGISWLALAAQPAAGFARAIATGLAPFVVADLVKLAAASGIMPALWRVVGRPNTSRY